jgi:muramoyltetrapeptide carboxypeptidase
MIARSEALESMRKALFGEPISYHIAAHPLNKTGKARGVLTGGNLSVLYSLSGSVSDIETQDKILFLEDLDEYLYHIDRMMVNLDRAGKLGNIKGLIIGGMTEMKDNKVPFGKTAEEIIAGIAAKYRFPVCFGFPSGHIDDNRALILGRMVELSINRSASRLIFE